MLVLDVSINRKDLIDEIYIQRIGGTPPGNCKYKIRMPEGYDKIFVHKYSDGYFPLLCKVLNYLKREGYKPTKTDILKELFLNGA